MSARPRIEVFPRRDRLGRRRFYFRVVARNGEVIAQSEAYTRKESALTSASRLRNLTGRADRVPVVEVES